MNVNHFVAVVLILVATESAAAENVIIESLPDHLAYFPDEDHSPGSAQVVGGKRLWKSGDELKVCFFGGTGFIHELIVETVSAWSDNAAISFDFGLKGKRRSCVGGDAGFNMIRIGFGEKGYWSTVGTDSVSRLNQYQPSMNLQGMDVTYFSGMLFPGSEGRIQADKAVILHEFGHALGLLHEHQNPALKCEKEYRWEGEGNVYDYLLRTNGWDRSKVTRNLGPVGPAGYADKDAVGGEADRDSIMMYALPKEIFVQGEKSKCFVAQRYVLSAIDKKSISEIYPKPSQAQDGLDSPLEPYDFISVAAPPISERTEIDMLERAKVDLKSNSVTVRREARRQLAAVLQNSGSAAVVRTLSEAAASKNYRVQLGTLVALENVQGTVDLTGTDWAKLIEGVNAIKIHSNDTTLTNQAEAAMAHIKTWPLAPANKEG